MAFPFLAIFLLFLAFLTFNRIRTSRKEQELQNTFWQKEAMANATRKKDTAALPYIALPLDTLPMGIRPEDEVLTSCENTVTALASEKILNLTGMSNTDLKLAYGAPNLTFLTQCDQNFTDLVRTMQTWGARLHELGLIKEAEQVLSLAVGWGSDIKGSYVLLANIYQELGRWEEIPRLKERASKLKSLMKEPILAALKQM